MKRFVAAMTMFVIVTGCSSSAPTPAPGPAPGPNEKLLSSDDLDGDGKADAVFGVPKPEFTTYTSIRAVAASGETLLALNNADGDLSGAVSGQAEAPTPVLVIGRVERQGGDRLTPYLYDKAAGQMAPIKWAGAERQNGVWGKAGVDDQGHLEITENDLAGGGRGSSTQRWLYKDGLLGPMFRG